jgi:hypothetical protein
MRVRAVFADESVWSGDHTEMMDRCPSGHMVRLDVTHPDGCTVTFLGWDYIGIRLEREGLTVVQWKEPDAKGRDGTPDPYAGHWGAWSRYLDGGQESDCYHPLDTLPAVDRSWPGLWLDDDVARRVGVL